MKSTWAMLRIPNTIYLNLSTLLLSVIPSIQYFVDNNSWQYIFVYGRKKITEVVRRKKKTRDSWVCKKNSPETEMLESKKPSQFIKKLQSNEVELKVHFLDETTHTFGVKVSIILCCIHISKTKSIIRNMKEEKIESNYWN